MWKENVLKICDRGLWRDLPNPSVGIFTPLLRLTEGIEEVDISFTPMIKMFFYSNKDFVFYQGILLTLLMVDVQIGKWYHFIQVQTRRMEGKNSTSYMLQCKLVSLKVVLDTSGFFCTCPHSHMAFLPPHICELAIFHTEDVWLREWPFLHFEFCRFMQVEFIDNLSWMRKVASKSA